MPPFYRLAEVSIYSVLNSLPFMLLALYPFSNTFRFSKKATVILVSVISVIEIFLGLSAVFFLSDYSGPISTLYTLLYMLFFLLAVKAKIGKTVFTLLMLSNIANLIVDVSKCVEGIFFHSLAIQRYRWSFSLMTLLVEAALLIPLFIYIKYSYTPVVKKETYSKEWRYLWLIPATFYLIWYYFIYSNDLHSSLEISLRPYNAIFFLIINLGACLIYYVVSRLILTQEKYLMLREDIHQLKLYEVQYENLREKIADARRAKHDVRHHVTLMQDYLKRQAYDELDRYLDIYQKSLPDDTLISYCDNHAADMVLQYYAYLAKANNIDYIVKTTIPASISIVDNDLSITLGNLLENALHACIAEKDTNKKLIVHAQTDNGTLYITIDNTFTGTISRNSEGVLYSSKHNGTGIGTESVKHIVNKYNGIYQTDQKDGMFFTSVMLLL